MEKSRLTKATVLVPLHYNDGTRISKATRNALLHELYLAFDGYTDEGVVEGAYRIASGEKQIDKLSRISIVLTRRDLPVLRKIVQQWCAALKQEAMYFEIGDQEVEFIRPAPEEE